jgi:predicted ArsR family transcriptional regulator
MKRELTTNEETAIRLCHHDFGGENMEDAAIYMGVKRQCVYRHLYNARKKTPQLFPILWPQDRAILALCDQHTSQDAIAVGLGISIDKVRRKITFLRQHGFLWNRKPDQYCSWMDEQVKEKF